MGFRFPLVLSKKKFFTSFPNHINKKKIVKLNIWKKKQTGIFFSIKPKGKKRSSIIWCFSSFITQIFFTNPSSALVWCGKLLESTSEKKLCKISLKSCSKDRTNKVNNLMRQNTDIYTNNIYNL